MLIEWNAHVKETACNSKKTKGRVMATEGKVLTERACTTIMFHYC